MNDATDVPMWPTCDTSRLSCSIEPKFTLAVFDLPIRNIGIRLKLQSLQNMWIIFLYSSINNHLQLKNEVFVMTVLVSSNLPILSWFYKTKIFKGKSVKLSVFPEGFSAWCFLSLVRCKEQVAGKRKGWEKGKAAPRWWILRAT